MLVVVAVAWGIIGRRVGKGITSVSLLHIGLGGSRIDGEKLLASFLVGDVAGSQGSVVEWSHAAVIVGRVYR